MKKLHFLTAVLFAVIGGLLAFQFGFNPLIGGFVGVSTAVVAIQVPQEQNVLRASILDLTAIVGQVDLYFRQFGPGIWTQIMKGVDFEQYMTKIPNQKGEYISTSSTRAEFLQPFQSGFQAKGGVTVEPYTNYVRRMKVDYLLDNLDELFNTYLAELAVDETRTPDQYPFVKWLIDMHIVPGITEELRTASVKGVYAAPTPGTAGAAIAVANGIFTTVTNEITATNIVPIVTGAVTSTNIVDKVELFHDSLPEEYKAMPGDIFMSATLAQYYLRKDRELHGNNNDWNGTSLNLYGTQKKIVGLPQLNGSSRMLFTENGNMLCMYDKLVNPAPTIQLFERDVKILADMHRGWGFKTLHGVFANDQA